PLATGPPPSGAMPRLNGPVHAVLRYVLCHSALSPLPFQNTSTRPTLETVGDGSAASDPPMLTGPVHPVPGTYHAWNSGAGDVPFQNTSTVPLAWPMACGAPPSGPIPKLTGPLHVVPLYALCQRAESVPFQNTSSTPV